MIFFSLKPIYLAPKIVIVLLFNKKITILAKYLDLVDMFLNKLAIKLYKYFGINKYIIHQENNK